MVDNEFDIRTYVKNIFNYEGYEVQGIENSVERLEFLEKEFTGILLIDLNLSQMNGWTIIKK
jgi:DNA-binding response OmpR family regulator